MSRSYKKPYSAVVKCDSSKEDKVDAHRKFRRKTKHLLKKQPELIDYTDPDCEIQEIEEVYSDTPERLREVSDVWSWRRDGNKHYWGGSECEEKISRK